MARSKRVTVAEVAGDRRGVTRARMRAGQGPAAQARVGPHGRGTHRLDDRGSLPVPELADVEVPRHPVDPVGPDPAEQDVTGRLHEPLTLDHPMPVVGVLAPAQEGLQHRGLGLLGLEEQRVIRAIAQHQGDPGAGADAPHTHHLVGRLHEVESLDQAPVIALQAAAIGVEQACAGRLDVVVLQTPATGPAAARSAVGRPPACGRPSTTSDELVERLDAVLGPGLGHVLARTSWPPRRPPPR